MRDVHSDGFWSAYKERTPLDIACLSHIALLVSQLHYPPKAPKVQPDRNKSSVSQRNENIKTAETLNSPIENTTRNHDDEEGHLIIKEKYRLSSRCISY